MLTPYTGSAAYCFSNSLHMCLRQAGMADLPGVDFIECLTGMPFGAMVELSQEPMFFPSPPWADPDAGLTLALECLSWTCETWCGESQQEALTELHAALRFGPALLGPLRMRHLSYDASRHGKADADHFIVVFEADDYNARVHDPQGFPFAVLPLDDLLATWDATGIFYAVAPYTLRHTFRQRHSTGRQAAAQSLLAFIRANAGRTFDAPPMLGGAEAYRFAAEAVQSGATAGFIGMFTHFALPLGARRCTDAVPFLQEAGESELAKLMLTKASVYGEAQRHAIDEQWQEVTDCLDRLNEIERQFIASCTT